LLLLYPAVVGLIGGIISTCFMTLIEVPSWRKWGLHGVFEWHENQVITIRLLGLSSSKGKQKNHFKAIFFFHFLNGTLAGIIFPYIVLFLMYKTSNVFSFSLLGVIYGIMLWIITLAPIHKPITGFSPWNHPLGRLPALTSISGHLVYGAVLGLMTVTFIK
jgi:hypothetical protein